MQSLKAFVKKYPAHYKWLQFYWHKMRRLLETRIFGSKIQEWIWQTRHLYKGKGWAEEYLLSVHHPHRVQIVEAIESYLPMDSILEIGCNAGANLILIHEKLPGVHLFGVDINKHAINVGQRYVRETNIKNIELFVAKADRIDSIQDVDVVFTDAVLMFIGPDKIKKVLSNMGRMAKRGIILNEYHTHTPPPGNYMGGRWVYNYKDLILSCIPTAQVDIVKSAFTGGDWDTYGSLIIVRL